MHIYLLLNSNFSSILFFRKCAEMASKLGPFKLVILGDGGVGKTAPVHQVRMDPLATLR